MCHVLCPEGKVESPLPKTIPPLFKECLEMKNTIRERKKPIDCTSELKPSAL